MGTRAVIQVLDNEYGGAKCMCAQIYVHCDGYPTGLLWDIKELLGEDPKIVNGLPLEIPDAFDGMGCFAAWLVGSLKKDQFGDVYLLGTGTELEEEWTYKFYERDDSLYVKIVGERVGWNGKASTLTKAKLGQIEEQNG